MNPSVFFKSDYTDAGGTSTYGRLVYEIRGMEDPDRFFELIRVRPGITLTVCNQPRVTIPGMAFRVRGFGNRQLTEFKLVSGTNTPARPYRADRPRETGLCRFSPVP